MFCFKDVGLRGLGIFGFGSLGFRVEEPSLINFLMGSAGFGGFFVLRFSLVVY